MKRTEISILISLFIVLNSNAQIEKLYRPDGKLRIDTLFQISPEAYGQLSHYFECIIPAFYSATEYPEIMRENNQSGVVIASIIVYSNSKISDIKIEKSSEEGFNEEVLKCLASRVEKIGYLLNTTSEKEKYYFPFIFELVKDNWEELMLKNKGITIEKKGIIRQCSVIKH